MLTLKDLTEETVVPAISRRDLALAEACIGQLTDLVRDGETLSALVQDEAMDQVSLTCQDDSIYCRCTCDSPGPCRHAHALLLAWLRQPEAFDTVGRAADQEPPLAVRKLEPPPARIPDELPGWAVASFAMRRATDVCQLAGWLDSLRLQDLRQTARRRGWRLRGADKAGICQQVAAAMAAPAGNLDTALGLNEDLQRVLASLIVAGRQATTEVVARVLGMWGKGPSPKQLPTYTLRLQELGLALPAAASSYGPYSDFCPDTIGRWLLPVVHQALSQALGPRLEVREPVTAATEVRLADPLPFVRAVGEIALLLDQEPVPLRPPMPRPLLERRYPGLRGWDYDPDELRRMTQKQKLNSYSDIVLTVPPPAPSLLDDGIARLAPVAGDAERLEFIYALLATSRVVAPGSPVTVWPDAKRQYLKRTEAGQRAVLARAYFDMTGWSEVWGLWAWGEPRLQIKRHAGYAQFTQEKLRRDLAACRLAVVRALACLPDGEWLRLDGLYPLLRALWPRFDEPPVVTTPYYGPATCWFLARADSDARFAPQSNEDWDLAQGRFVRRMLTGPLHWLGLADLRFENGQLAAFRLRGLADLFWDRVDAPAIESHTAPAPQSPAVATEGSRIIVRPSAISAQAHGLLGEIARLVAATSGRFEYELDGQSTYRAFQAGVALSEIIASWQELFPTPMPEAIHDQLARWWEAYGRVHIYEGLSVIEFADEYALAEMKAVTSLAQHIVAEVTPRLVVVEQEAVPTLVAELEKAGYTPKQTNQV